MEPEAGPLALCADRWIGTDAALPTAPQATPAPTPLFSVPGMSWFTPYVQQYSAWLAPDATILSVAQIDLVATDPSHVIGCSEVSYKKAGVVMTGVLGLQFRVDSGTLGYNPSAGWQPAWNNPFFPDMSSCDDQGYGTSIVASVKP